VSVVNTPTQLEAPPPADPPRPLIAKARRRAWNEPHVRFWWVSALVFLLIGLYFCVDRWRGWLAERRLIEGGTRVEANIDEAGGTTSPGKRVPPDSEVVLNFTFKGRSWRVNGLLPGRSAPIEPGTTVPIRIDPDDPHVWTARTRPAPLGHELLGALLILPLFPLLLAVSLVLRARVMSVWRHGQSFAALVVDSRHSALAPWSHAVRCTPRDGRDNRLISVFLPRTSYPPQPGTVVWLVAPPDHPHRSVAAMLFE